MENAEKGKVIYLSPEELKIWEPINIPQTKYDYGKLRKSIEADGVRNPVVIDGSKSVISGNTRVKIAIELGLTLIPVLIQEFEDEDDKIKFFIGDNLIRRHLTKGQKIELGLKLEKIESRKAKQRIQEGAKLLKGEKLPKEELEKCGKSLDKAANKVGISPKTLVMAKALNRDAPELYQQVISGEKAVSKAYKELKQNNDVNNLVDVSVTPVYNKSVETYAKVSSGYVEAAKGMIDVLHDVFLSGKDEETLKTSTYAVLEAAQAVLDKLTPKVEIPEIPDWCLNSCMINSGFNLCKRHSPCPKAQKAA